MTHKGQGKTIVTVLLASMTILASVIIFAFSMSRSQAERDTYQDARIQANETKIAEIRAFVEKRFDKLDSNLEAILKELRTHP